MNANAKGPKGKRLKRRKGLKNEAASVGDARDACIEQLGGWLVIV
jgi:hypothetical protein